MRVLVLLVVGLILGCDRPRVENAAGSLRVDSSTLPFPRTFVGYSSAVQLSIQNTSKVTRSAALEIEAASPGPFRIAAEQLEIPGGATAAVQVELAPTTPGPQRGTLRLTSEGELLEIALSGEAVNPPACAPSGPCRTARFDPALGTCQEDLAPDGTSCASATPCLETAHCQAGSCIGDARACDDGNACSLDACDPTVGCVHFDRADSCPAPADPCKAAVCDPAQGCGQVDAPDGTPCGPADCVSAHVCIVGKCEIRAVPEGATCAPASPCQGRGICRNQVCEQPPVAPLQEIWSYTASSPYQLSFSGITDEGGNLYWLECPQCPMCDVAASCIVSSATAGGVIRFRQSPAPDMNSPGQMLLSGPYLVLASPQWWVRGLSRVDGSTLWEVDLNLALGGSESDPAESGGGAGAKFVPEWRIASLLADARGQVIVQTKVPSWLLALDAATGATRWRRTSPASATRPALDELGNLYFGADRANHPPSLVSLAPTGQERWSAPGVSAAPEAVFNGRVFRFGASLVSTLDGAVLPGPQLWGNPPEAPRSVLLGNGVGYVFGQTLGSAEGGGGAPFRPPPPLTELFQIDPLTGAIRWSRSVSDGDPHSIAQPVLTASGSVLFAYVAPSVTAQGWHTPWLVEIDRSGNERFRCELPSGSGFDEASLASGRLVLSRNSGSLSSLHAFSVPGIEPAGRGWMTRGGTPGREGRPR